MNSDQIKARWLTLLDGVEEMTASGVISPAYKAKVVEQMLSDTNSLVLTIPETARFLNISESTVRT